MAATFTRPQSVFFFLGTLETLMYADPIGNEQTLHQAFLMPVRSFSNVPAPWKDCDRP
jgi:hypothetical protein